MYTETAGYYDLIYHWKDYDAEVQYLRKLMSDQMPGACTLLDVACGTGAHLQRLKSDYDVTGIDLDPRMVEAAAVEVPDGTFAVGDMSGFDLGRRFDVVTCLFSSIGFVKTITGLEQAMACFRAHVVDDGLVVVEPWFRPDSWKAGTVHLHVADQDELKISRMTHSDRAENVSITNMSYLIGTPDGVDYKTERHEMGLFTMEEMLGAFEQADLLAEYDPVGPSGRGLYTARPNLRNLEQVLRSLTGPVCLCLSAFR